MEFAVPLALEQSVLSGHLLLLRLPYTLTRHLLSDPLSIPAI
jgi:hypothetical protein